MTIEICKQIASELEKRYMEIMDYGGDQSEADSVGTPFKDGHLAIEFALKEIERLTSERDEARMKAMMFLAEKDFDPYPPSLYIHEKRAKEYAKKFGWDCFKGDSDAQTNP